MDKEIICPVCGSKNSESFFNRLSVPVHQNFLFKDKLKATGIEKGDIYLAICKNCGFIYNYRFDKGKLQYGESYDNTQTCSPYFQSYIDSIIGFLTENYDIMGKNIVEVGCGKGSFLKSIVEATNGKGYGFDPSYVGPDSILNGRVLFEKRFYNNECSNIYADMVVCRHVIEHEADPVNLLHAIHNALSNSPNALVFFETPNVEWILKNKIAFDIFYEHCSYFCGDSITYLFEECGFNVKDIKYVFNGQYMWVIASTENESIKDPKRNNVAALSKIAHEFKKAEDRIWVNWNNKLQNCKGNIAIWGAGAKGVTLVNEIDQNNEKIKCVIDINPNKIGGYLPGTGHLVIDYKDISKYGISDIVVLNSNYIREIETLLKRENINVNLINGEDIQ